ncbi:hypothetical protein M0802_007548 [Mischocyttarus mexicanus]|nr:hypothetical protein M0802_007548 [Mischocyttarus mexicanus]
MCSSQAFNRPTVGNPPPTPSSSRLFTLLQRHHHHIHLHHHRHHHSPFITPPTGGALPDFHISLQSPLQGRRCVRAAEPRERSDTRVEFIGLDDVRSLVGEDAWVSELREQEEETTEEKEEAEEVVVEDEEDQGKGC